ncbi:cytochrome P450 [Sphaerisporangium corydalis]|uniref:Cytochrome P450 n=1 Tax=Sphaerisporangium corydalis TaxID=1441875 RepID=A0ABV9EMB7_9ACTN|nr:cytochrome P450 [Sphaerisporangium corydalis]
MKASRGLPADLAHPFSPRGRADPYPAYRWLRANDPVHFDVTSRMWLLTGHADCALALRDPRFSAALGQRERVREDALPPSMLTTDPPEHQRLRSPGALLLGPAAIRGIAAGIAREVDEVMAGLAGRTEVEVTADIGEPVATGVLARLFGLPAAARTEFAGLAARTSVNLDPLAGPKEAAAGRAAMGELTRFLGAHADRALGGRDEDGRTSPFGRLAADDRLTRPEMLGVASLAIVGGWKPLAEMVGNALYWLLPRPEEAARLREGGEEAAGTAVDELLRVEAPIPFIARVTTEAVPLDGGTIPSGARVLALIAAANRDPAVFDRPDDLVVTRSPNPHLAFGGGTHFCLGAPLVRHAGALLLHDLLSRYPGLRATGSPPVWAPSLVPRRLDGFTLAL